MSFHIHNELCFFQLFSDMFQIIYTVIVIFSTVSDYYYITTTTCVIPLFNGPQSIWNISLGGLWPQQFISELKLYSFVATIGNDPQINAGGYWNQEFIR